MEAVAALGLASNVFQFVQFASGMLDTASTIYQSATGAGAQSETLENVYSKLSQFSRDLGISGKYSDMPQSRYEDDMVKLAAGCESKCQELLQLVGKLKVAPAGKRKAWKSLRAALLTVCHQDDFRRLEREIDSYQKAMTLLTSANIKYDPSSPIFMIAGADVTSATRLGLYSFNCTTCRMRQPRPRIYCLTSSTSYKFLSRKPIR